MRERFRAQNFLHFRNPLVFCWDTVTMFQPMQPGPNQSLEPTQHFAVSFRFMRTSILKVLGASTPCR